MKPFEEKIIKLTLDINTFKSASIMAIGTLGKIKEAITNLGKGDTKGATASLVAVADQTAVVEKGMEEITSATKKTSSAFNALKTMATGALLGIGNTLSQKILSTMKKFTLDPITDGFKEYELKTKSMQTIITNTGESVSKVNGVLDELNKYSDLTIYNFNDMTKAIGSLSTSGMKLGDSTSVVKGFFNLAAGTGVEAARASSLLDTAMVQAIQIGKMDYQNWKQLQSAGMGGPKFKDSLIQNAKAMGIQVDLSKGFNESLKQGWATTEVMLATMKEFENDKSLLEAATKVRTFSQLMDTALEAVGSGWARTWEIIFGDFDEATALWSGVWGAIEPIINGIDAVRNGFLLIFKEANGFKAFFGIFGNIYRFIKQIADAIGDGFTSSLGRLGEGLLLIPKMLTIPFKMLEFITRKIADIKIIPMVIGGAFKALFSVFGVLTSAILVIVDSVADVFDWFKRLGNLMMDFGKSVPFKNWFQPITDLQSKLKELFSAIPFKVLLEAFANLGSTLKKITVDPLLAGFKALVSPIVAVAKAIATLSLDPIRDWSKSSKEIMTSAFSGAKDAILKVFSVSFWKEDVFGGMKNAVADFTGSFSADKLIGTLKSDIKGLGSAIKDMFTFELPSLDVFDNFFKGFKFQTAFAGLDGLSAKINLKDFESLNGLLQALVGFSDIAGKSIRDFSKVIKETFATSIEWIGVKFVEAKDHVNNFVSVFTLTNVLTIIDSWVASVKEFNSGIDWSPVTKAIDNLESKFISFKNIISDALSLIPITDWTKKFQNGVQSIIDTIFGLNKTKVQDGISTGIAKIGDVADGTKTAMEKFGEAVGKVFSKMGEMAILGVQYTIDGLKMLWNGLVAMSTGLVTFITDTWTNMSDFKTKMQEWGSNITEFFKNTFSTENLVKGGILAYLGVMLKGFFDFQRNSNGIMDAFKNGLKGLSNIPNALGEIKDALLSFTGDVSPISIMKIAGAIAILALSIKLMSTIDGEALKSTLGFVAMAVGSLLLVFGAMTVVNKLDLSSGMIKSSAAITSIASGILIMAGALKILSSIDQEGMNRSLQALMAVVGFMSIVMLVIGKFKVGSVSISIKGIMGMASALLVIAEAVRKFAEIPTPDLIKGLLAVIVTMTALGVALKLIGNTKFGVSSAVGIVGLASSLVIVAGALRIIGSMPLAQLEASASTLTKLLLGMTLSLATLSLAGMKSMAAATAIGIVAVALTTLVIPITALGLLPFEVLSKGLITTGLALGGITLALMLLSSNAIGAMAGAASIAAVAAALMILVVPITILGTMKIETLTQGLIAMAAGLGLVIAAGYLAFGAAPGLLALAASVVAISAAAVLIVAGLMVAVTLIETVTSKTKDAFGTLVDNILYFMERIKMALPEFGDLAVAIIDTIASVLERSVPRIAQAGINIIIGLMAAIASRIEQFTTLAILIILEFTSALTKNLKPVIDAAIKLALALIEGLAEGISKNADKFTDAVSKVVGAVLILIVEGLELVVQTFFGWIPKLSEKAEEAGDAATEGIRKYFNLEEGKKTGKDGIWGVGHGIAEGTPDVEKKGKDASEKLNEALGSADTEETGTGMIDEFLASIGLKNGEVNASGVNISDMLNTGLGSADTGTTGIAELDEYLASINGKTEESGNAGVANSDAVNTGLGSADTKTTGATKTDEFGQGVEGEKENVKTKAEGVSDAADKGLGSADTKTTGGKKADEYGQGLDSRKGQTEVKGQGVAASANKGMADTSTYNTGGMKVDQYSRGIESKTNNASRSGQQVSSSANRGLGATSGWGPGNIQAGQYATGLGTGRSTAESTGSSVARRGDQGLQSVSTWSSGTNFGQGFINGLNNRRYDAEGAAFSLGAAAAVALNKGAGNASPSRFAKQSGIWFGQGMINGLKAMVKGVDAASFSIGDAAVTSLEDSTSKVKPLFEAALDENLNLNPIIKPTFDMSNINMDEFTRTFRAFSNNNFEASTVLSGGNRQNGGTSTGNTYNIELNIPDDSMSYAKAKTFANLISTEIKNAEDSRRSAIGEEVIY